MAKILSSGEGIGNLPPSIAQRVKHNAHVVGSKVEARPLVRVFVGQPKYSCRFKSAVDLGIYRSNSLLQAAVRCADGRMIQWWRSPKWNSVLRGCRAVLDLQKPEDRRRAKLLRKAIIRVNPHFDLLTEL